MNRSEAFLNSLGAFTKNKTERTPNGWEKTRVLTIPNGNAALKTITYPRYQLSESNREVWEYNLKHIADFTGVDERTHAQILSGDFSFFDMAPFIEARKKISGNLKDFLASVALSKPRRKRCLSEYDGEFVWDRRFDIQPFIATKKENSGINRTVTLNIRCAFASCITPKQIMEYGALVWAINDALENAGIQTNINQEYFCRNMTNEGTSERTLVSLKKTDEYVTPQSIAMAFTPWHYRTIHFAQGIISADANGETASSYLGQPIDGECSAKRGEINLSSKQIITNKELDLTKIKTFLEQSLGLTVNK